MEKKADLPDSQQELIDAYCGEARELMMRAHDRGEALAVKDRLCERFASECKSSLVRLAASTYVDSLLRELWGETPETHRA